MGKIYDNVIQLIGNTPILHLHKMEEEEGLEANIYAKVEGFNPGGSVKDRAALNMIEAAEKEGKLKPGGRIVEGTSGNTGITTVRLCRRIATVQIGHFTIRETFAESV